MKTILICIGLIAFLACSFLTSGCIATKEDFNYLGTVPAYATQAPHAENCGCCSTKVLTPPPSSAILEEQQSKKGISMSIGKNARCSQVMKDVNQGKYVKNNRFHSFGSVATDCLLAQQAEADRRLVQIKLQRNKG